MHTKRLMAGLSVAVITGVALTACSSGVTASSQDASGKVTYMTWESTATNAALDASMKTFMKSDKSITVTREDSPNADYAQKLSALIISKKAPSFFWCSTQEAQNLASEGLLYDWSSYLKEGDGLVASKFAPGALDLWKTPDGKLSGIPTLANTYGFYYNKTSFTKAGLTAPAAGWTWSDLYSDLTKLKQSNPSTTPLVTQWQLLSSPLGVSAYSEANGGAALLNDSVNATKVTADATFRKGASLMAQAVKSGQMTNPDYDGSNAMAAFSNGGIPLMFGGQWLQALITPKAGLDYGFAPWPAGTAGSVQPIEANGVCSPATLSNPAATWKTISYMDSTAFNAVMAKVAVAPIAYLPGTQGYYKNLNSGDDASKSIAATVKYELGAKKKFSTSFLEPWATKGTSIVTTQWNPALDGKTDVGTGVDKTVSGLKGLIGK